ncbi:hypothetical protein HN604_01975 [archaeon]|jgi:hypothetical protein|nr:hypothetical protein [archaeon]MBT6182363.1 hypothetical protein [archaeon]MBT6606472.1 hypothetical protein [archaeon]MBT7251363.1 hypothetical protein [archaeon]MBT7660830.1 hypothetical protein [archaeon]
MEEYGKIPLKDVENKISRKVLFSITASFVFLIAIFSITIFTDISFFGEDSFSGNDSNNDSVVEEPLIEEGDDEPLADLEEICGNLLDDGSDGDVDCEDFDCSFYFDCIDPPIEDEDNYKDMSGIQVWITPHGATEADFSPSASWDETKDKVHVFKFYIGKLGSIPRTETVFPLMNSVLDEEGIYVGVESGGLREARDCNGFEQANFEFDKMSPWLDAGGRIDFIAMDSPYAHSVDTKYSCNYTIENASREVVKYISQMRILFPGVKIGLIEPVPWYTFEDYTVNPPYTKDLGDLEFLIEDLISVLDAEGETIDFIHLDSPYNFNEANQLGWEKLVAIQDYVKEKGIRFGLIFNSQEGGDESNQKFYEDTLDGKEKFYSLGGNPDDIIIQSWYSYPDVFEPEEEDYTFTNLVNTFID